MTIFLPKNGRSGLHKEFQDSIQFIDVVREDYLAFKAETNNGDSQINQETSGASCTQWLADRSRKVFLAQVGVGSVDQALLSVVYSKHNTLRMYGLARKILVIDEVHAYDPYMQILLQRLLFFLGTQQQSVVLLSATLPHSIKENLIEQYQNGLLLTESTESEESDEDTIWIDSENDNENDIAIESHEDEPFPLITMASHKAILTHPVETPDRLKRVIKVNFIHDIEALLEQLIEISRQGKCAVWIRNTVRDVQDAYHLLNSQLESERLLVFHSRYAMGHRQNIEYSVLEIFGKDSTSKQRAGKILIASQVVEQSLDLDFDEMFTDLCPIDLIIQRSGRLRRHPRDIQGNITDKDERGESALHILAPDFERETLADWYSDFFPSGTYVYQDPGMLWRTAKVLHREGEINIPSRSRFLIEQVYGGQGPEIPQALREQSQKNRAEILRQKTTAINNLMPIEKGFVKNTDIRPWPDSTAPTRLTQDSKTYRLALLDVNSLKPICSAFQYPWPMSEVKYREMEINYDQNIKKIMQKTNDAIFDKGKGAQLMPMVPVQNSAENFTGYECIGSLASGKKIIYDEKFGLRKEA